MRRVIVWLVVLLLAAVAAAQPAQAETAEQNRVMVDGKDVAFDVEPTVVDWVLMVPIRAVAESMGGKVTWQAANRTAVIETGAARVEFTIDSDVAVVNGQKVKLAAPVTIRGDRTLVPASFLLTLFNNKLTINSPALKDPVAMALLEKGRANDLRNVDLQVIQLATMTTKGGPGPQEIAINSTIRGQVRGDDALVDVVMEVQGQKIVTATALRGNKAYSRVEGQPWTPVPYSQAAMMASQELNSLQMLLQMVKEAHLGQARTVSGQKQQDVVVTFDVATLKAIMDQLMGDTPPEPGVQFDIVWENATATLTVDTNTGAMIKQVMDAAISQTITAGSETTQMRTVMHQEAMQQRNDQPIAWPADLPK